MLKPHGGSAGAMALVRAELSTALQAQWHADCATRLLCVLALDSFGDWAGGTKATAPVRETAAQALSVLLRDGRRRRDAGGGGASLLTMQGHTEWEVRHGALLGLKYLLATHGVARARADGVAGGVGARRYALCSCVA